MIGHSVIGLTGRLNAKLSDLSLTTRCAMLLSTVLGTLIVAAPIAYLRDGIVGLEAVALAAVACGVCSTAALILSVSWHGTSKGVVGVLAGSLIGMLPPLAIGLTVQHNHAALAAAGAFGWIVVFFLTSLVVKTLLVAPVTSRPTKASLTASVSSPNGSQAGV